MNKLKRYMRLKKNAKKARQKADKAAGALEQVMKQLKDDFGCLSLSEAKKKLNQLKVKERKLKKEFEEALTEFEDKWNEQIE